MPVNKYYYTLQIAWLCWVWWTWYECTGSYVRRVAVGIPWLSTGVRRKNSPVFMLMTLVWQLWCSTSASRSIDSYRNLTKFHCITFKYFCILLIFLYSVNIFANIYCKRCDDIFGFQTLVQINTENWNWSMFFEVF